MIIDVAAQEYPERLAQSPGDSLEAEERIERLRIQQAQEMRRYAEEVEQESWTRLREIIDARARLSVLYNQT